MKLVKTEIGVVLYCEGMQRSCAVAGGCSVHQPAGQSCLFWHLWNKSGLGMDVQYGPHLTHKLTF
jgi:hypothetical protein